MNTNVWRRACNSSNCVEVRRVGGLIEVRDSKLGEESNVLGIPAAHWPTFVMAVAQGEATDLRPLLDFDEDEWESFYRACLHGEFDDLTAEWRSAALADVDPDSGTHSTPQPVSVELSADSGPVVSDVHPAVQAVLDVTPVNEDGCVVNYLVPRDSTGDPMWGPFATYGPPEPIAARQAAAVHREIVTALKRALDGAWQGFTKQQRDGADHVLAWLQARADHIDNLADQVAPKETPNA